MKNRIPKNFRELDKKAHGVFTSEKNAYPGLNMKNIIKHCRSNNINPEKLTDKEIKRFCSTK